MSAHPAGPRHADIPHAPNLPERPTAARQMIELPANVWPRNATRDADGVVRLAGVPVHELAAEFGTPLFVVDEDDFRSRCRDMVRAFGDNAKVHYASKAFLCGEIARWIRDEGLSLDVCSGGELAVALRAGFPAERIALHGNNKSVPELEAAVRAGVGHVVLDSLIEIERLEAVAKSAGVVQDVLVRLTVGVEAHTHEYISTAHEDQKFGFSVASGDAMQAIARVFESSHLRMVGLHSHIGSQIFDIDGFEISTRRMLGVLREAVDKFGAERAAQISILDLGGGLGISYLPHDDPPALDEFAAKLDHIVTEEAAHAGLPKPTIAVEPGRAIAGPGTVTLYEVGTIKDVTLDGGNRRRYVSVDGGMSDNIRPALYQAEYDCRLVSRTSDSTAVVARVVGKHCESGDIVIRDTWMPADVGPGDLIAVAATGAYCYSMSSRYNMLTRPAVVAVRDGKARLILRRETVEDLLSLEVNA
ncbi:Diaminopimelate decarboxylase [Nocardia otitidiscaviarum]|uniref:Diaminopimelate decarboxylase n=1 Tax=Nocardia otitidiscaviarum TaxID=1823 RepID=A0A378YL74_9NOCA|nr:diaminopimelate decarboxylase [Nocardia otitidiscaviarum]MBF6179926.1 diaminopimelate decarboxylase [Nocardia otitidiscaviarum]MBF6235491.1 diaminopimelate decarboxylase [Nocardia otitidiscaviarum]MCP9620693.1 diaminopimelate decarboxylase [Nocardia otitidiscaviarum]QDP81506.1 diaminopimelate decarboxylase [Nocardia otitidiscaviarum]SUA77300.1 Diaminopimelate decarboxylase [Nocardia otitidiscaviarum]